MKSLIMMSLNSRTTGLKKPLGNVLFLTESRGFDLYLFLLRITGHVPEVLLIGFRFLYL